MKDTMRYHAMIAAALVAVFAVLGVIDSTIWLYPAGVLTVSGGVAGVLSR